MPGCPAAGVALGAAGIRRLSRKAVSRMATEMAIADFGGTVGGKKIELVSADIQNKADVAASIDRLRAMSYEQRVANGCIGAERADLVLAGYAFAELDRDALARAA